MPISFSNFFLQNIFDKLVSSYVDDKVGIAQHFINPQLAAGLLQNLQELMEAKAMHHAGTGNKELALQDKLFRSDMIYWLDRSHQNKHENAFFDLMEEFISYLNRSCYTGITGYEFHYTCYEPGSFYKKHIDQFKNNQSRQFSLIMYLNADWKVSDGGELCIHHAAHVQHIAPANGTCVFFKSDEMAHEVLQTNKPRFSITGWLKKD